ncbi:MAG: ABC transporter permease subunit [Roseibium album]|uniref:Trehalose transport system permease protein SugB n=1 Tax=Roseibium album TaxID=311410 RepID=A0A0M6ZU99_9HYPH|nr:ABC transporter permease subunit [Roseibium album]MBG6144235.1 putative spermidine/putrescine transport system permease protein [Labrenzia sp. EL_142]MBG6162648.1 putative spermidine/putrescine transport system permease protein [Labrenzia sp. EL_195]MBG6177838.1 putative spermidine/putrescine transport system permease protein [Labrenzia sp. EL_132]MBG6207747.1 putative spermidine/putrescine transport system permease protein [Labrenzia sp. EL_126]MBG6232428.1 putative spermidine/putrescine t
MSAQRLNQILLVLLVSLTAIWLIVPFSMAILWSLVDPAEPWTADKLVPPVMSFYRWQDMWENSSLQTALVNSYLLAPSAAIAALALAMPTAFALGRIRFPGREVCKILALLPLIVPPFVTSIFFTSMLYQLGLHTWRFGAILFAHAIVFMPYAIRIMTVSFEQVRSDHIDAARDLGASAWARWKVAYLPALKPGIFASLLIVFIQSIEEFALAFIVGSPDFTTIPTLLYGTLGQDFVRPNAAVLSLILVVPNVILMLILERLLKSANPALSSGKG